jgi:hypothetical protein
MLDVPAGYISGTALSGSATFADQTLASLGLTPGTYVYKWNSSAAGAALEDDSLTVHISGGIPEPSTRALMALGFAGLGVAGWRSRRRSVAIAA